MTTDAPDTGAVSPDRGVYATKRQPCGCKGVPVGQHLHGCPTGKGCGNYADRCPVCGYRTATIVVSDSVRRCGGCGAVKP